MTDLTGDLRLDDDRVAVRFERTYDASAADVWDAITSADRLARWFAEVSGDFHQGGEFLVVFGDGDENRSRGRILTCQPPHRLEVTWTFGTLPDESILLAEIVEEGEVTTLVIDHRAIPVSQVGYAAGWQAYLDRLGADLAGRPLPDWWETTSALLGPYQEAADALRADG
jgi:uncharacterized protein YndB with AHSA1/START domain